MRLEHGEAQQPLTDWRAKDRHYQQAQNTERHGNHSPTDEPSAGIISRFEIVRNSSNSPTREPRTGIISRLETQ
jgi:hypothetical protein